MINEGEHRPLKTVEAGDESVTDGAVVCRGSKKEIPGRNARAIGLSPNLGIDSP
jgi:hypothetical protein